MEKKFEELRKKIIAQLPPRTRALYEYCITSDPCCITASIAWEECQLGVSRATVKKHLDILVKQALLHSKYEDKESEDWIESFLQAGNTGCRTVYAVKGYPLRHLSERNTTRQDIEDAVSDIPRHIRVAIKTGKGKCENCNQQSDSICAKEVNVTFVKKADGKFVTETKHVLSSVHCATTRGWDLPTTCTIFDTFKLQADKSVSQ